MSCLSQALDVPVSRRRFLQWTGIAGAATGVAGASSCGLQQAAESPAADAGAERVVWSACTVNCGSRCPLRLVVSDGQIVRVDPDDTGDDELGNQQIRACVRGRSIRQRIYNPDRLKKPMKRVGKRGEGKWAEISWDEAFTLIADKLKEADRRARQRVDLPQLRHGRASVRPSPRAGRRRATAVARLMNCVGGYLDQYNDYSAGNIEAAVRLPLRRLAGPRTATTTRATPGSS